MPLINTPITTRSYELIRNQIGLILADELFRQSAITYDDTIPTKVFIQRDKPFTPDELPAVNVSIDEAGYDNHTIVDRDGTFKFVIDVYGKSKKSASSEKRGDEITNALVQRLAGIVEGILSHPVYNTLAFTPPFIMRSIVTGFTPGTVDAGEATNLSMVRVSLSVKADQSNPEATPISEFIAQTQWQLGETANGFLWTTGLVTPPPPIDVCDPAELFNSNNTFNQEIPSGNPYVLPNTEYDVFVNGVFDQSVIVVTLDPDEDIIINV